MKNRKMLLASLLSIALVFSLILPTSAAGASATVPRPDDQNITDLAADSSSAAIAMALNTPQGNVTPMVSAGSGHTVGLKADGTVVALGYNDYGRCDVGGWTDIVQVSAGGFHTVGLKDDGTVVAVGDNNDQQCDVGGWTDIIQVAAGNVFTVELKSDGTVVAVGYNYSGQCDVGGWTGITQVAARYAQTVGVRSDGTVVAVGFNDDGRCDVGNWTDIVQVAAGGRHTVGLKSDRTVVAVGYNRYGQCDVGGWTDIIGVSAGGDHTVGVRADGTVVAVGDNDDGQCNVGGWTDIVQVAAGEDSTVGVKSDGTVVAAGPGSDVARWNLVLAVPPSHFILTISSTAVGSVTTPGEGVFTYDPGTVVNLVVEPGEGYRFVRWTGDVDTIGDVNAAATNITIDGDYSITANLMRVEGGDVDVEGGDVGIKAGDWIKLEYTITGWPAGQPYPEWLKLEFLSVEGTTANVLATMRMSDGTEQSDTVPVDVVAGGEAFGFAGLVISANLTTGDSVYITGYGNVTIEGETTRTYAGARRTVVYTSLSQYGVPLTYYWDKLTGVTVEASTTYAGMTATDKATETNMWEAGPPAVGMPWWPWIIVAAAVVGVLTFFMLSRRAARTKEG